MATALRAIHSADWHLGLTLHRQELAPVHRAFIGWLAEQIRGHDVDLLLLAGDIYDQAQPSASAQALWFDALSELKAARAGLEIVVIAGNHDSLPRLAAAQNLLRSHRVHIGSAVDLDQLDELLLPVGDHGEGPRAWCALVPYLRAEELRIKDPRDYAQAVAALYRQLYARIDRHAGPANARIALGHGHLAGGSSSPDSERPLLIGGLEAVDAADLGAWDYIAFGHLHLAQRLGPARYSGSPIALSFSETDYPHQVVLLDFVNGRLAQSEVLLTPPLQPLLRVPPRPARKAEVLAHLAQLNPSSAVLPWVQARVRLDAPEPDLVAELQAAIAGRGLLLDVDKSYPDGAAELPTADVLERVRSALSPAAVFSAIHEQQYGRAPSDLLLAEFAELLADLDGPSP